MQKINLFLAFCAIFFYGCETKHLLNKNAVNIKTVGNTKDPLTADGRSVMVHLFEWKWTDIAKECERFLGPNGFGGIQISPPNEHAIKPCRQWWERYQPVSYRLISRSGNESEFIDMVERCNAVGVRIYVDAVINHMAAGCCESIGHSDYDSGKMSYPDVPYSHLDFNTGCAHKIEHFNDEIESRNCGLEGMPDLKTGSEYVRNKIAEYMNNLIDIGVAGFRIDAAKHIWPGDLEAIFKNLKDARKDIYGPNKRPFIYQEVADLGSHFGEISYTEYTNLGRITEFKYGRKLSEVVRKQNNQQLRWLRDFGMEWSFMPDDYAIAFIDNHDTQRSTDKEVLTYHDPKHYKIAASFMLAWPYGLPQLISSYDFNLDSSRDNGPPSLYGITKDVKINPDETCGDGWICEHRWRQIKNMVKFRNVAENEPVQNWWDNQSNQIAFSRGNRAFIAINNDEFKMDITLQTGLPAGLYCDVNSGDKVGNECSGRTVTVNHDGTTRIEIPAYLEDPVIAIHLDSKI